MYVFLKKENSIMNVIKKTKKSPASKTNSAGVKKHVLKVKLIEQNKVNLL